MTARILITMAALGWWLNADQGHSISNQPTDFFNALLVTRLASHSPYDMVMSECYEPPMLAIERPTL